MMQTFIMQLMTKLKDKNTRALSLLYVLGRGDGRIVRQNEYEATVFPLFSRLPIGQGQHLTFYCILLIILFSSPQRERCL